MRNNLAIAAACRTGGADRKESLTTGNLTGSVAMPAAFRFGALLSSVAVTFGADLPLLNFNLSFDSKNRIHEIQADIISQIRSGHGPAP